MVGTHSLNTLLLAHKDKLRKISPYGTPQEQHIGYSVPASMSEADRRRLNQAIDRILKRPDIQEWFRETTDLPPEGGTPEHYESMIRTSHNNIRALFGK